MALYPNTFWSDPSLNKPKSGKKEVKKMACKTTKKKSSCKTTKKGGK